MTLDAPRAEPIDRLRDDVHLLGALVGEVLGEQGGADLFQAVEHLRTSAIALRSTPEPDPAREQQLLDWTQAQSTRRLLELVRAFSVYFHLINLAEQQHRLWRLREGQRRGVPLHESIGAALAALVDQGIDAPAVESVLATTVDRAGRHRPPVRSAAPLAPASPGAGSDTHRTARRPIEYRRRACGRPPAAAGSHHPALANSRDPGRATLCPGRGPERALRTRRTGLRRGAALVSRPRRGAGRDLSGAGDAAPAPAPALRLLGGRRPRRQPGRDTRRHPGLGAIAARRRAPALRARRRGPGSRSQRLGAAGRRVVRATGLDRARPRPARASARPPVA